tara:strand:- start:1020 stop:1520 length:501 start_codon:yes stop_codon:yes gene_type:complete
MAYEDRIMRMANSEDIGFRGPHFNENVEKEFSFGLPRLAQQLWNPQDEYGGHYEHEGFKKQLPVPYGSKGTEYGGKGDNRYGEFTTGTNLLSPYRYPQDDVKFFRGPGPWNDFSMGIEPWLTYDFEPMIEPQSNLDNWDLFHLMSNGYTLEEAQEILERQLGRHLG